MKSYFSTNRVLAAAILGIAVVTLFFACKKDNNGDDAPIIDEQDNTTIAAASHEGVSDALYNDLFETASSVIVTEGLEARTSENEACLPTSLIDNVAPDVWPKTIKIDFGTACADGHGRVRSGILWVKLSKPLTQQNATVVIRLDNYKVNNIKLEGIDSITNLSGTNGKLKYSTVITGGKVTKDTISWNYSCDKTITREDAGVYSVEGTATLTYPNGNVAKVTTVAPLIKSLSCAWIEKGQARIELNNHTGIIDYGNGVCDSLASITVGDKHKEIKLPR